jgi:hypothetical protein
VVTGKLDVREAAAKLPDEVDEPSEPAEADVLVDLDEDELPAEDEGEELLAAD